jgi:BRE1 E3 ubiquitin ligase
MHWLYDISPGVQKAKSDNKFYAAMRDKEAIEAERKNISRNMEKQAKVIERLADTEKNLLAQVVSMCFLLSRLVGYLRSVLSGRM